MAETTNEFEDPSGDDQPLFTCGICENMLDTDESISKHKCLQAYPYFYIADDYYVYPVEARSKKVVSNQGNLYKEQEKIGDLCLDHENQENTDNNNIVLPKKISTKDPLFTERFIQSVQEREALWNIKGVKANKRGFHDKLKLWQEISKLFSDEPSVDFLKSKWKNLTTQYQRVRKRLQGKSGQEAPKPITWSYFDQMSFLQDVDLNTQETISNIQEENPNESLAALDNFQNLPPINEVLSTDDIDEGRQVSIHQKKKQRKNVDTQLKAAETLANAIQASTPVINFPSIPTIPPPPPPTEASAFAQLVEVKLNSIPNDSDRDEVMENMFTFLTAEMKRVRERSRQQI